MGLLKVVAEQDRKLKDSELRELARDQTINDLRKKTRLLQQSVRRKGKALEASKKELETCKSRKKTAADSIESRLAITRTGAEGTGRYLTLTSRISLGIRRNFSNVACGDLSLILLDDASRFVVARAEVQSAAALMASHVAFHAGMMEEGPPPLSIHVVSQDATNSAIWQKRKLCALLLHTAWLVEYPDSKDEFTWDFDNWFLSLQCAGDVQPVDDGTGGGALALCDKMLRSIGSPTIKTLSDFYSAELNKSLQKLDFQVSQSHSHVLMCYPQGVESIEFQTKRTHREETACINGNGIIVTLAVHSSQFTCPALKPSQEVAFLCSSI